MLNGGVPPISPPSEVKALNELIYDNWASARSRPGIGRAPLKSDAAGLAVNRPATTSPRPTSSIWRRSGQKAAYAKGGTPEVAAVTTKLTAKFPNISAIAESGRNQIRVTIGELVAGRQFRQGAGMLKEASTQLTSAGCEGAERADLRPLGDAEDRARRTGRAPPKSMPRGSPDGPLRSSPRQCRLSHPGMGARRIRQWRHRGDDPGAKQARRVISRPAGLAPGAGRDRPRAVIRKGRAGDFEAAIALAERGGEILPAAPGGRSRRIRL